MSKRNVSGIESFAGVQVWYTNCTVYTAGNVDGGPGWIEEDVQTGPDLRARAITAGPMISNRANQGTQLWTGKRK
jgi:hypothetical protein